MNNFEENKREGWIGLYRSLKNHWIYPDDRPYTEMEAWIDLLLSVNHKERPVRVKNKVLKCKRGQSVRSLTKWAERWKWSKSKVYRFFELLQSDDMIETESETVTTRVTVCNFGTYQFPTNGDETQSKRNRNDEEMTPKRPGTESESNKNDKNAENEEEVREVHARARIIEILKSMDKPDKSKQLFSIKGFGQCFLDYWIMRYDKYEDLPTEVVVNELYSRLIDLKSEGNSPINVIRQSIRGGYKDFFKDRDKKFNTSDKDPEVFANAQAYNTRL